MKVCSAPGRDDTALRRSSRILVLPARRSSARQGSALKDPSALGTQGRPPRKRIARRPPPGRLRHGFGVCGPGPASRPRPAGGCRPARQGKQPHGEPDQRGQQQDVIHIAQHGDEVGDQVDGAQGVGDHEGAQGLGIPGRLRALAGKPQGDAIALDASCPGLQSFTGCHGYTRL